MNSDLGLNLLDYGARWYDAAVGRFTTIDQFTENYSSMTGYQYGANNPVKYVDVNGDSLELKGPAVNSAVNVINEGVGSNLFELKNGKLIHKQNLTEEEVNALPSEQKQLYLAISNLIGLSNTISINFVENSEDVAIAHFAHNTIDMGDVLMFGTGSGINKFSVLAHELGEQTELQSSGNNATLDCYKDAHGMGISLEQKVGGHIRIGEDKSPDFKVSEDKRRIVSGSIYIKYSINGNKYLLRSTWNENNITKVERRNVSK